MAHRVYSYIGTRKIHAAFAYQ